MIFGMIKQSQALNIVTLHYVVVGLLPEGGGVLLVFVLCTVYSTRVSTVHLLSFLFVLGCSLSKLVFE